MVLAVVFPAMLVVPALVVFVPALVVFVPAPVALVPAPVVVLVPAPVVPFPAAAMVVPFPAAATVVVVVAVVVAFGHGRCGFMALAPSGVLQTNSNDPTRKPSVVPHIWLICINCGALNCPRAWMPPAVCTPEDNRYTLVVQSMPLSHLFYLKS